MKRITVITILMFLSGFNAFSQIQWERLFSKRSTDTFRSIQEVLPGGGYIAAGCTADSSANDSDAYVVRLNNNGDTLWTFTYNGPLSKADLFYKIINTSDGGFLACGYTESVSGTSDDLLYIKLNSLGQIEWTRTYGGSGKDRSQDVVETYDGYTICGYTSSSPAQYYDVLILHINFNGNTLWSKIIGDVGYDDANALEQLPDSGYILGGQSNNGANGLDQFLIRTNVNGDTMWTKHIGGLGTENIESLTLVSNGFVFSGSINDTNNNDDGYLVKTDTFGTVIWTKIYGSPDQDDFHRVEKTSDGGYILSGTVRYSDPDNTDLWLFKTDSLGDSTWAMTFGGLRHDHGYSAVQTSDGGFIIAGYTGSFGYDIAEDAYIIKIGPNPGGSGQLTYIKVLSLATEICKSSNLKLRVKIINFGNAPASSIPVTIELTGAITQTLNGSYGGPLNPPDYDTVSFNPTINTTAGGILNIYAYTGIANTVYPENNSFSTSINLLPCVGIDELETQLGYTLYPNPSHGNIVLDFSKHYSNAEVDFINCTGSIVKKLSLDNTYGVKSVVDVSSFAKGLYFVKVNTEQGFDVRKFILE